MRRLAWAVSVLALFLVWLLRPSPWAVLLLAVLILAPPASWVLLLPERKKVRLEMNAPGLCGKGETVSVQLTMKRQGRRRMGGAGVILKVENMVTGEITRCKLSLLPEAVCELRSEYCGCLRTEIESARLYDMFGVLSMRLASDAVCRTLVLPDIFPVEVEPFASYSPLLDSQEYAQDRKGQDRSETFQIREYVPGDHLSLIHWKLSSKQDKLVVRESACPIDHTLTVVLDRFHGDGSPKVADALTETVLSVCQALSEESIPFRMCWKEDRICTADVRQSDDFTSLAGMLLNARPDARGMGSRELGADTLQAGGRVLYFGTGVPEMLDVLESNSTDVRMFLCGAEPFEGPNITGFTPETVREALRELRWGGNR